MKPTTAQPLLAHPVLAQARARWQALAPREQQLVQIAAVLVGAALLWWVALAPALATLRNAPAKHAALDAQLQSLQALQAEALQLQATASSAPPDGAAALRTALTQRLGTAAQMQLLGDRVTITLQGAPADALAQWLAQARSNARAQTTEARLTRSTSATNTAPAQQGGPLVLGSSAAAPQPLAADNTRWDGSLILALPGNR